MFWRSHPFLKHRSSRGFKKKVGPWGGGVPYIYIYISLPLSLSPFSLCPILALYMHENISLLSHVCMDSYTYVNMRLFRSGSFCWGFCCIVHIQTRCYTTCSLGFSVWKSFVDSLVARNWTAWLRIWPEGDQGRIQFLENSMCLHRSMVPMLYSHTLWTSTLWSPPPQSYGSMYLNMEHLSLKVPPTQGLWGPSI